MLTQKMLEQMPFDTVFATGLATDEPNGLFLANTGKQLRWVAVRGGFGSGDWAIYAHTADNDIEWIKRHGDKVHDESHIRRCVECDDEALARYRQ